MCELDEHAELDLHLGIGADGAVATSAPSSGSTAEPSSTPGAGETAAASGQPVSTGPSDVAIHVSESSVGVPTTIEAGPVALSITNIGKVPHDLLILKNLAPSAYPVDKNGNIIEAGAGINLLSDGDNIDPKGIQTRELDLTQPGTYVFVCNTSGQFKAGMFTVVTVTL